MGSVLYARSSVEYSEITSGTILDWTQDATWMFWVYPESEPAFTIFGVASAWNSSADWWRLRCTDLITGNDDLILEVNGDSSGTSAEGTAVLNSGTWSHIAIVRSGNTWTVYVDGVSDITFSKDLNGTPSKIIEGNTYDPNTSGAAHTSDSFDGRFAARKAWQAALTVQEILTEMRMVYPVRTLNLHEFWPAPSSGARSVGYAKGLNYTEVNTPSYAEGPPIKWRRARLVVQVPVTGGGTTHNASATMSGEGTLSARARSIRRLWRFPNNDNRFTFADLAGIPSLLDDALRADFFDDQTSTTHSGAAALSGEGVMSCAGSVTVTGSASLSGEGTLTAAGSRTQHASVTMDGDGSLTASGLIEHRGASTLSGEGIMGCAGQLTASGAASLTGEGTVLAAGQLIQHGASSLEGEGVLIVAGQRVQHASVTMDGDGTLSAVGQRVQHAAANIEGEGVMTCDGTLAGIVTGSASLSGEGTLTAAGGVTTGGAATLSGEGTMACAASVTLFGVAALVGDGTLTVSGIGVYVGTATIEGEAVVTCTGTLIPFGVIGESQMTGEALMACAATVVVFWLPPTGLVGATIAGSSAGASRIPSTSLRGTYP